MEVANVYIWFSKYSKEGLSEALWDKNCKFNRYCNLNYEPYSSNFIDCPSNSEFFC